MLLNDSQTTKNEINEAIKSIKDLNELKDEKGGNSLHVLCLKSSESKNDIELVIFLIHFIFSCYSSFFLALG